MTWNVLGIIQNFLLLITSDSETAFRLRYLSAEILTTDISVLLYPSEERYKYQIFYHFLLLSNLACTSFSSEGIPATPLVIPSLDISIGGLIDIADVYN